MSEFENMPQDETTETTESTETSETAEEKVSLDYILNKIAAIQADDAHIRESMEKIAGLGPQDATAICAIREIAVSRETTNQQMLAFYSKLYDDMKPVPPFAEWGDRITQEASRAAEKAGRAAEKAGQRAKDMGKKVKVFFRDLDLSDSASWEKFKDIFREAADASYEVVEDLQDEPEAAEEPEKPEEPPKPEKPAKTGGFRDKVLDVLANEDVDGDTRELLLDNMGRLKKLDPAMRDKVLKILTDEDLDYDAKSRILEEIEAISSLDD